MSKPTCNRRRFLKLSAAGLATGPVASFMGANIIVNGVAQAADLPLVEESDPIAIGLKYTHDAASADTRTDATATCANCQLYTDPAATESGPCTIFAGKSVKASGWCASWVVRA